MDGSAPTPPADNAAFRLLEHYHCTALIDPRPDGWEVPPTPETPEKTPVTAATYLEGVNLAAATHYMARSEYMGPVCVSLVWEGDAADATHLVAIRTGRVYAAQRIRTDDATFSEFQTQFAAIGTDLSRKRRVLAFALVQYIVNEYSKPFRPDEVPAGTTERAYLQLLLEHVPILTGALQKMEADTFPSDLRLVDQRPPRAEHCVDVLLARDGDDCAMPPALAAVAAVPMAKFARAILRGQTAAAFARAQASRADRPKTRPFRHTLLELVRLEEAYVRKLEGVQKLWRGALLREIRNHQTDLPPEWRYNVLELASRVFPDVSVLAGAHAGLLERLRARDADPEATPGDVARDVAALLDDVLVKKRYKALLLSEISQCKRLHRELFADMGALRGWFDGNRSFLLAQHHNPLGAYQEVIQRLPNYLTLLRELDAGAGGDAAVAAAARAADAILRNVHECEEQSFSLVAKRLLLESFGNLPKAIGNTQTWVACFELSRMHHTRRDQAAPCTLVLLSDTILLGRPRRRRTATAVGRAGGTDAAEAAARQRQLDARIQAQLGLARVYEPQPAELDELRSIAALQDSAYDGRLALADVDLVDVSACEFKLVVRAAPAEAGEGSDAASIRSRAVSVFRPSSVLGAPATLGADSGGGASGGGASNGGASNGDSAFPSGPPRTHVVTLRAATPAEKTRVVRALRWALTVTQKTEQRCQLYAGTHDLQDVYFRVASPAAELETRSKIALVVDAAAPSQQLAPSGYPVVGVVSPDQPAYALCRVAFPGDPAPRLAPGDLWRLTFDSPKDLAEPLFHHLAGAEAWLEGNSHHYDYIEAQTRDVMLHDLCLKYYDVAYRSVAETAKRRMRDLFKRVAKVSTAGSDARSLRSRADSEYTIDAAGSRTRRLASLRHGISRLTSKVSSRGLWPGGSLRNAPPPGHAADPVAPPLPPALPPAVLDLVAPSRLDPGPALLDPDAAQLAMLDAVSAFLEASAAAAEDGLYRKSGSHTHVEAIEAALEAQPEQFAAGTRALDALDPNAVAQALKRHMGKSPRVCLPDSLRQDLCTAAMDADDSQNLKLAGRLAAVVAAQPDSARKTAMALFVGHLWRLSRITGANRMTAQAIATSIAQSYLSSNVTGAAIHIPIVVLRALIENYPAILGGGPPARPELLGESQETLAVSRSVTDLGRSSSASAPFPFVRHSSAGELPSKPPPVVVRKTPSAADLPPPAPVRSPGRAVS